MTVVEKVKPGYIAVFERAKHNWSAYVPDLPGCTTTGRARRMKVL